MRTWILSLLAVICFAGISTVPAEAAVSGHQQVEARSGDTVRIGILAYRGVEQSIREWAPLIDHLNHALPGQRFVALYLELDNLRKAIVAGSVDFVLTNPGHYAELEAEVGISRIATLQQAFSPVADQALGATVIAAAGRQDLQTLEDMRGQVLAATSQEGFGGYQIIWRELAELDLDPERDLAGRLFVGFPMQRVLEAVADGRADVGIVRACLLESLPDWQRHYRVLGQREHSALDCAVSSRLYPDWPMATLRHTPPDLARAVAVALLQMPDNPQGIAWTVPADYQSVHALFQALQIGPYAHLKVPTLQHLAQRYWLFLLLATLALLGWGGYTLRVEYLVRQRTSALERALQEREALEARMRAGQEQADHLSRLSVLGELSSTLAHELNQPLAGVGNYAQSLLRRLDNGRLTPEAVREASTGIMSQAQAAEGIVRRIRGFVRKRAGLREIHALPALVQDAVALFSGMLSQAPHIEIDDRLAPGLRIMVDPLQIQQVVLNFLKNALDALRAASPDAQRIDIVLEACGEWVCLRVRDRGVGMSDAQLARLFEPFYTTKEDGLGLGLSICKSIAEAHGGQLSGARPDDGTGMVFSLCLPVYERTAEPVDLPD
ncbi:PhnD/SsuA/transferrin family substrate-binding protein [Alcaligenaceae bacterium SJ-26]|nr:PhnD/SsuA/transferrin family substrate-binding protein [Alcaligenaceae bacterium SJ-26]